MHTSTTPLPSFPTPPHCDAHPLLPSLRFSLSRRRGTSNSNRVNLCKRPHLPLPHLFQPHPFLFPITLLRAGDTVGSKRPEECARYQRVSARERPTAIHIRINAAKHRVTGNVQTDNRPLRDLAHGYPVRVQPVPLAAPLRPLLRLRIGRFLARGAEPDASVGGTGSEDASGRERGAEDEGWGEGDA